MPTTTTPELFIKVLAEMLGAERERTSLRLLRQNRLNAQQFLIRQKTRQSEHIVAVDVFQMRAQRADRFLQHIPTRDLALAGASNVTDYRE